MAAEFENPDALDASNASRRALSAVADKWIVLIVHGLQHGVTRPGDLSRWLGGVGHPVVTRALRRMEAAKLVTRTDYPEVPPRVEYALTERGQSLAAAMESLSAWADANHDVFPPEPVPAPQDDEDDGF